LVGSMKEESGPKEVIQDTCKGVFQTRHGGEKGRLLFRRGRKYKTNPKEKTPFKLQAPPLGRKEKNGKRKDQPLSSKKSGSPGGQRDVQQQSIVKEKPGRRKAGQPFQGGGGMAYPLNQ